jgi:hypothetical protein
MRAFQGNNSTVYLWNYVSYEILNILVDYLMFLYVYGEYYTSKQAFLKKFIDE